jgi:hypothetical protein
MKKIILTVIAFAAVSAVAQQRTCGTNAIVERLLLANPELKIRSDEMRDYIHNPDNPQTLFRNPNTPTVVVTIPVVFHVLYKNDAQNISDAQINSQLAALNRDFRKPTPISTPLSPPAFRPFGADIEVNFCKATRTPTGATTTGITREAGRCFL